MNVRLRALRDTRKRVPGSFGAVRNGGSINIGCVGGGRWLRKPDGDPVEHRSEGALAERPQPHVHRAWKHALQLKRNTPK